MILFTVRIYEHKAWGKYNCLFCQLNTTIFINCPTCFRRWLSSSSNPFIITTKTCWQCKTCHRFSMVFGYVSLSLTRGTTREPLVTTWYRFTTGITNRSLELFEEIWGFKVLRHWVVQPGDDFVNGLLPWLLGVSSLLDRLEELPERLLHHKSEVRGNLQQRKTTFIAHRKTKLR